MRRQRDIWKNIDWVIVGIYLVLVLIGWINIYAAVYNEEHQSIFDFSQNYGKQLIWIATSLVLAGIILLLDGSFFTTFAYPIYGVTILLLLSVLFLGVEVNGARSWFQIGSFKLQPSEFAKFATLLALSKYLSGQHIKMEKLVTKIIAGVIIGLPALLILKQNDTGSTLVYASFLFVMYREGLSGNILLFGLLAILIFVLTLIFGPFLITAIAFYVFLLLYSINKQNIKFLLVSLLLTTLVFILYSKFNLPVTYVYIYLGGFIGALTLYLLFKKELKKKGQHFLYIILIVGVSGFIYSIDFAFNNILKEHQRTRITVLLGEEDQLEEQIESLRATLENKDLSPEKVQEIKANLRDKKQNLKDLRKGALWNIKQSLIAIGSGGFSGKGFLQGTQTKFDFVPEQSTDFIFCTVGEEWGFIGSFIVIALFINLFIRIIVVAERQRSIFSRIYGYGVASILFFHVMVNIGMTIGVAPVIGIPLPFLSYGGSSLWAFTILLFIFVKLDSERLYILR
ncbi:MAG: rod shape-determining protein RodA [Vicingaceae bacterium]